MEQPKHPGDVLRTQFMKPAGITQTDLARQMGMSLPHVNELINGKRKVTASTAVRLAQAFGNDPAFWLVLQVKYDLAKELKKQPRSVPAKAPSKRPKPRRSAKR